MMRLHRLTDWPRIENTLVGLYKHEQTRGGGPEPYSPLGMFKLVLLGQWHRLSDAQLEQALRVRLDFLVFCEFDLGDALPDHTTICRRQNRLVAANLDEQLLAESNRQLVAPGAEGQRSSRRDHRLQSIIQAAAHPNRTLEVNARGNTQVRGSADALGQEGQALLLWL